MRCLHEESEMSQLLEDLQKAIDSPPDRLKTCGSLEASNYKKAVMEAVKLLRKGGSDQKIRSILRRLK